MDAASRETTGSATAGVITRPPLLYLACLLLGLGLDYALPWPLSLPEAGLFRWTVGGVLILAGVAVVATGFATSPAREPRCPATSRSARW
jgi:hypothetical protein